MKKGYIISFVLGLIIATAVSVYAINASEITYNDTTVEGALDTLYGKAHLTATPVATLTTRNATYTMQNDGYIAGTATGENVTEGNNGYVAYLNIDGDTHVISSITDVPLKVSVYVRAGSVIQTRSDHGTYNLTVYEWR